MPTGVDPEGFLAGPPLPILVLFPFPTPSFYHFYFLIFPPGHSQLPEKVFEFYIAVSEFLWRIREIRKQSSWIGFRYDKTI